MQGDQKHLLLAHLFDKPCFLGILAMQVFNVYEISLAYSMIMNILSDLTSFLFESSENTYMTIFSC